MSPERDNPPAPALPGTPEAEAARTVTGALRNAGFEALLAGGCVRDLLLGRSPKDYDVATSAHPDAVVALFPDAVTVGRSFGVVRVPWGGVWTEVATFRRDRGYTDGRHPDSVEFATAREDARRRDFTVNAMFMDPSTGSVTDYAGGRDDLRARLIRCVGKPDARFREDHLRLLRAVRFAATLEFALDPDTEAAVARLAPCVRTVSPERIRDELVRALCDSARAGDALRLLDRTGLLAEILPEVSAMKGVRQPPEFHPEGDVFTHTCLMLDALPPKPSAVLALAVLLHDVGKPPTAALDADGRWRFMEHAGVGGRMAEAILRRLRFSSDDTEAVVGCVRGHMRFADVPRMKASTLRRLIGNPLFALELELHRLDCIASHGNLDHHAFLVGMKRAFDTEPVLPQPWVTGRDILDLGLPASPAVGVWKQRAYDAQLEGLFATREDLLAWLQSEWRRAHPAP